MVQTIILGELIEEIFPPAASAAAPASVINTAVAVVISGEISSTTTHVTQIRSYDWLVINALLSEPGNTSRLWQ